MSDTLRERVARAMCALSGPPLCDEICIGCVTQADAAIALVLEEAAKECMADLPGEGGPMEEGYRLACEENARNIRAMKGKSDD